MTGSTWLILIIFILIYDHFLQFLKFFFFKKSGIQFIENLQDGRPPHVVKSKRGMCIGPSSNFPALLLPLNNILQKNC